MTKQILINEDKVKLALEALNKLTDAAGGFSVSGVYFNEGVWEQECLNAAYDAIKALEEALAKQDPKPFGYTLEETMKCWDLGYAAAVKALAKQEQPYADKAASVSNAYDLGFEYAKENMLALPVVKLPLEVK